jgi:septation ring formation regulator
MEYILVLILIVIGLITLGFFFRKKHYREIDKLEAWKMDIMNRPVLDELAKIKQLNMTGETEELFERWRKEWDSIITVYLPDVEELLFDAEEYVDKYRFSKSKAVQQNIEEKLKEIESSIQTILSELHELVGSEEKNRTEIDELKEAYRTSKKSLLAHRHTYGTAAGRLEVLLEQVVEVFSEFEDATENGNYLKAREYVLKIKSMLRELSEKMEVIPDLLVEIQSTLPSQIEELKDGHSEMIDHGYILNHIEFEKEISRMELALEIYSEHISKAETAEIEVGMLELRDNLNVMYDLLEKEAVSKQFVHQNNVQLEEGISFIQFENDKLKTEITFVQQTYHITESELVTYKQNEKQLSQLVKRFEVFRAKVEQNQTAYSLLADDMKEIEDGVSLIKQELKAFTDKLQTLRKDEIDARNTVSELKKKLASANRMIAKSNLPGLPISYKEYLQEVIESLEDVHLKLEEKPLDMAAVHIFLEKAVSSVNEFYDLTSQLIEQMYMAERVIQYGNRYRSKYQSVAVALKNAEDKFMSYEFEQAVEEAASALEKVEPGCLQKLEFELNLDDVK